MTRRGLFGLLAMIGVPVEAHVHKWQRSPLYVTAAVSYEEPGYYPPSGLIPVQLCSCGLIRVEHPERYLGKDHSS